MLLLGPGRRILYDAVLTVVVVVVVVVVVGSQHQC
jgi:hypothetical protein